MFDGVLFRQRRGLIALLCVIALHLMLYAALRGSTGWKPQHDARHTLPAVMTLRLLPWPERATPAAALEPTPKAEARSRRAPAAITFPSPLLPGPPTPAPETPTRVDAAAAPAPAPPASQPPRALDITLPRGFALRPETRNPAIDDPRANTARTTPEERLAAALDTRVIEEALGDGRKRIRRGADCVIVTPSRIGQLMPFNDAAARTPATVGACP